jgi:hypothetical protein
MDSTKDINTGEKKQDEKSVCPFKNKQSVVEQHAYYFSKHDKDGTLTSKSITDYHTSQKITKNVWIKQKAILNILCDKKLKPTAHNISIVCNPASTGIWDSNGIFNEDRFNQLCSYGIKIDKKTIITKDAFDKLRSEIHGNKDHGVATRIGYVIPVPSEKITDGSIDELFEYYNNCWYVRHPVVDKNVDPLESAFTEDHLKLFYTEPWTVMDMRAAGKLPAKKHPDNIIYTKLDKI